MVVIVGGGGHQPGASDNRGRGVAVELDDVAETVSTWLLSRQLTGPPAQLVVGLDPGPRPGCAFFADGLLLGKREMDSIDESLESIVNLVEHTCPAQVLARAWRAAVIW